MVSLFKYSRELGRTRCLGSQACLQRTLLDSYVLWCSLRLSAVELTGARSAEMCLLPHTHCFVLTRQAFQNVRKCMYQLTLASMKQLRSPWPKLHLQADMASPATLALEQGGTTNSANTLLSNVQG